MSTCEPCGDDDQHLPHCDHSGLLSKLTVSRSLCADIHRSRMEGFAERDKVIEGLKASLSVAQQATTCARCLVYKHTPVRAHDGYVCGGCLEKEITALTYELRKLQTAYDQRATNNKACMDQRNFMKEALETIAGGDGDARVIAQQTLDGLVAAPKVSSILEQRLAASEAVCEVVIGAEYGKRLGDPAPYMKIPNPKAFHAKVVAWGTTYRPDLMPKEEADEG